MSPADSANKKITDFLFSKSKLMKYIRLIILLIIIFGLKTTIEWRHELKVEKIEVITIPNPKFDHSQCSTFYVASSAEYLRKILTSEYCLETLGLSSENIDSIFQFTDFQTNDYIITYQKEINRIYWSYLLRYFDRADKIPLDIDYQDSIRHVIYIYRLDAPKHLYRSMSG